MRKLNINVETNLTVAIEDEVTEEEILELTTRYRNVVMEEARKNKAVATVRYELVEE